MAAINFLGMDFLLNSIIDMGKVNRWEDEKESAITPIPFPGQDAHMTEGIDTLGVIKIIKFSGRMTGSDETSGLFTSIQNRINFINDIIDGRQISATYLVSPFVNGRNFKTDDDFGTLAIGNVNINTNSNTNQLIDSKINFILRGIRVGDRVKNLITNDIARITGVLDANTLLLSDNILPNSNTPYAVTANIRIKLLRWKYRWELPGLSYCDYDLEVMQVR